jgi:hypothetical protein
VPGQPQSIDRWARLYATIVDEKPRVVALRPATRGFEMSRRWKLVAAGLATLVLVLALAVAFGVWPRQCLATRSMGTSIEFIDWFGDYCQ